MKHLFKYVFFLAITCSFIGCSKGSDTLAPTPKPPEVEVEPDLRNGNAVVVDIDPGATNIFAVVGTAQRIEVRLLATPKSGVLIVTKLIKLADNTVVFTNEIPQTTSLANPVNVTGLIPGVLYNIEVVVTSKSNPSNYRKIEFKMAAK